MFGILQAALDTAAHLQGFAVPLLLAGVVAGLLRLHHLAGGAR